MKKWVVGNAAVVSLGDIGCLGASLYGCNHAHPAWINPGNGFTTSASTYPAATCRWGVDSAESPRAELIFVHGRLQYLSVHRLAGFLSNAP